MPWVAEGITFGQPLADARPQALSLNFAVIAWE